MLDMFDHTVYICILFENVKWIFHHQLPEQLVNNHYTLFYSVNYFLYSSIWKWIVSWTVKLHLRNIERTWQNYFLIHFFCIPFLVANWKINNMKDRWLLIFSKFYFCILRYSIGSTSGLPILSVCRVAPQLLASIEGRHYFHDWKRTKLYDVDCVSYTHTNFPMHIYPTVIAIHM